VDLQRQAIVHVQVLDGNGRAGRLVLNLVRRPERPKTARAGVALPL
jgi:hypothetical protein